MTYAGRVIGSLDRPPGPLRLVVTFNEHATPEAVQALLRNVTFENVRDDFAAASRTLAAVAQDDWGEQGVTASKTITLVPVNDAPVAVNDAYRVGAGAALDVAARGVLANDTDLDSPSLQAMLVAGPTGGSFALAPSGGFTYTPAVGFAGSDRFTYRAGDGALTSDVATATIVVDPARCAPRPPVRVEARPVGGTLAVTITAQRNELTSTNALVRVAIEDARNATIEVPAQTGTPARNGTANFEVPLTANTTELRFTVRRRAAGAVHVPLVVTDGCPPWRTFVGGGATAF